jgi:hypothetical protein
VVLEAKQPRIELARHDLIDLSDDSIEDRVVILSRLARKYVTSSSSSHSGAPDASNLSA